MQRRHPRPSYSSSPSSLVRSTSPSIFHGQLDVGASRGSAGGGEASTDEARCKRCRRTRSWCPTLPVRRFVQLPRPCHSDTSQTLSSSLNSSSSFIDLFFFQCTNQLPYIVTHRDVNGSNRIGFCYFHIIYHIFVADLIEADNDRMRI
jgi:uncharacterized protein with von Willebrand factor type A (vWA) domain